MENIFITILLAEFAIIITGIIFFQPYIGIVITICSLPVTDLLPQIPYLTSAIQLIGAITLISFLLKHWNKISFKRLSTLHILALLFIVWIFVSNPQASLLNENRNFLFTFIQLWILIWLTSELMDTTEKQHIIMWAFSLTSLASAIISISQGQIGQTISTSIRAGGLADQPNESSRYFVVSMLFFSYLASIQQKPLLRIFTIAGAITTGLAVFSTLSRTGILLLFVAIVLLILFYPNKKRILPFILLFIAMIIYFVLSFQNIPGILRSIMPSILQGTDTVGLRYSYWQAGWRMWLDHIIAGVGIGKFPVELQYYAMNLPSRYWGATAHNTYILVLAENGIIGLSIFLSMIISSLKNYHQGKKSDDPTIKSSQRVWLSAFIIILLGLLTKSGNYDKLLWFFMGMSTNFSNRFSLQEEKIPSNVVNIGTQWKYSKKQLIK